MGVIRVGNSFYFVYQCFALAYVLALVLILQNRSRKVAHAVLLTILLLNFALHFLKLAFEPYASGMPGSSVHSTAENICAVSTIFFPFIFLIKKQNVLHDFAYFIGLCGGLGALAYPTEAIGDPPFAFDTIRFYFCHINLMAVPLASAIIGLYRPRLAAFWTIPLAFIGWQTIICLNEFFVTGVGLVNADFSDLLNAGFRNHSFTFGVRPDFAWSKEIFDPLTPWFFKTDAFNINGGAPFYFPVLWMTVPAFVFLIPLYVILSSPFLICEIVEKKRVCAPLGKPPLSRKEWEKRSVYKK